MYSDQMYINTSEFTGFLSILYLLWYVAASFLWSGLRKQICTFYLLTHSNQIGKAFVIHFRSKSFPLNASYD